MKPDLAPENRRILEIEPAGRSREVDPRLAEPRLVDIHTDVLRIAGAILSRHNLGLGRDDAPKRRLVAERKFANDEITGLRTVASAHLQDEIAAAHSFVDVEKTQQ